MNIWQTFAQLNEMTEQEFSDSLIECAQAALAMELNRKKSISVRMTSTQQDGGYELIFRKLQ